MDDRAESALKLQIPRLEDGLHHILVHEVSLELDDELDHVLVHPAAVSELKNIADSMIQSGYEKECCLVYSSVRSHVLDKCLKSLGIEEYSIDEVKKLESTSTTLHDQVEKWIQALKILVKRVLTGEKFLCEQVFAGSEKMREVCFVESAKGCVMQMLNIGKAVAICGRSLEKLFNILDDVAICERSSEKLFSILDSYDALSDVLPDLEELFNGDSGAGEMVCREAKYVLEGLCEAASWRFGEFERAVREESPGSRMLENGDIHPLTKYVMDYVKLVVDYSEILNGVLEKSDYDSDQWQNDEADSDERMPCIAWRLLSLIKSLESNLEGKSRMYEDGGLQYVFLMNNVLYILNKLKDPEVRNMLGDKCISKRRDQIRQCAVGYLRFSWTNALDCLSDQRMEHKHYLAGRLRSFNEFFEEIYRVQTTWKIADPRLREELHILISEPVIQSYRAFTGRFSSSIGRVIKYSPDDLMNYLLDLFKGTPCTIQITNKNLLMKEWLCLCS